MPPLFSVMRTLIVVLLLAAASLCFGQTQPNVEAQREAMKKLSFLVGKWSGDASVLRGPGEPIRVRQTEEVQYKLDGLVLLVEGTGRNPETDKVVFTALATISYDESTGTYRFRSHNDGRYLDTDLKVVDKGFEWQFKAGPGLVRFVMRLTDKGEWSETGEFTMGTNPPRKTLEMLVRPQR